MGKTMRKLRRAASFVLALAMMVIMTAGTAFAAEAGDTATAKPKKTLSISADEVKDGTTFSVYQVLEAEIIGKDNDGKDLYQYTVADAFKGFFSAEDCAYTVTANGEIVLKSGDAAIDTDGLSANTNSSEAAKLAAALEDYAVKNATAVATLSKNSNSKPLPIGYYVVAETVSDKEDSTKDGVKEVASKPILVNLVDDANITPKKETVELDKSIVKENGNKVEPTDNNDVNIGDIIGYDISTNFPTYKANAGQTIDKDKLQFVLTDTFDAGLTYQETTGVTIKVGENELNEGYTAEYDSAKRQLVITFNADTILAHQGESVVASYSAMLNSDAVVGSANVNTVELKYTHNPNQMDDVKYLEDKTETYTYGFGIHKVDGKDNKELPDAKFEIKDKDGNVIKFVKSEDKDRNVTYTKAENQDATEGVVTEVVSKEGKAPVVKGLDAGTYTLTETKAPDDYTKLASDIIVKITEVKDNDGKLTGDGTLSFGEGSQGAKLEDKDGNETGETSITGNTIELNIRVENFKGITLPETGRNTALFCMIAGAAVVALGLAYLAKSARRKA